MTVSKERQDRGHYISSDQGIKQQSSGFCQNAKQWTSVCYRCQMGASWRANLIFLFKSSLFEI